MTISYEDIDFTDEQYLSIAESVLKFHCSVRNVPLHNIERPTQISKKLTNDYSPFYKYVSNEIFDNYLSKGIFQLGTIEQYRTIENKKQRDEFEGYSFLNLNINNHIISSVCSSGFNYLVFCATRKGDSDTLKEQFGEKQLFFPDVKGFAESICKKIQAKRYFIQNIEYNTLKLYINKNKIRNSKIDVKQILTPEYFDIIKEHIVYPSLFVKPESFKPENEVRIVFEMSKDIKVPLRFEHNELLKFIKY